MAESSQQRVAHGCDAMIHQQSSTECAHTANPMISQGQHDVARRFIYLDTQVGSQTLLLYCISTIWRNARRNCTSCHGHKSSVTVCCLLDAGTACLQQPSPVLFLPRDLRQPSFVYARARAPCMHKTGTCHFCPVDDAHLPALT